MTKTNTTATPDSKQNYGTVLTFYIIFLLALIMNMIPTVWVATGGFGLLVVFFVLAYAYRGNPGEEPFKYNQLTYLINSTWISSLFILVGMIVATIFIIQHGNFSAIERLMTDAQNGQAPNQAAVEMHFNQYLKDNYIVLLAYAVPWIGVPTVFYLYRLLKGLLYAARGNNVPQAQFIF